MVRTILLSYLYATITVNYIFHKSNDILRIEKLFQCINLEISELILQRAALKMGEPIKMRSIKRRREWQS